MRGLKAKKLRSVVGHSLKRWRSLTPDKKYEVIQHTKIQGLVKFTSLQLLCVGSRRNYQLAKQLLKGK